MLAGKSSAASATRRLPNREAALEQLYSDISAKNMFPFWATSTDVAHDEIKQLMGTQKAVPHLWSYKGDIEPILFRAAELVTMDDSERRSLILVNPGLSPRRATVSTMYTAYRLNDANEIMPPHKHSPSAVRFGLKGKGNFTGVDGENIVFGPGDMVLTPNDTWHNHGTVGDERALNLSVLDFPLVETLFATQDKWAVAKDWQAALQHIAQLGGVPKTKFDTCIADKALEDQVAQSRLTAAQQLSVNSTPTFFINGTKYGGEPTFEAFDKLLSGLAGKS